MSISYLLLVAIVEPVHSAIEAVVDLVGDEPHLLLRWAKDLCSAAVFVAVILAGVLWLSGLLII